MPKKNVVMVPAVRVIEEKFEHPEPMAYVDIEVVLDEIFLNHENDNAVTSLLLRNKDLRTQVAAAVMAATALICIEKNKKPR